jgi:hypothetical protein
MKLIKDDKRGKVFETDCCKIFYRNKNSISGDNDVNSYEKIIFIEGSAKITLDSNVFEINSPFEVEFPEKTYHKIEALSDIIFIILR